MKWIGLLGKGLRDAWLMAGMVCGLLLITNAMLDSWLDLGAIEKVSAGVEAPDKWDADFYGEVPWLAGYKREFRSARRLRWEPYAYWRRAPFSGEHINVDERGHRHTWQPDQPGKEAAIWMFGGSTVWGSGARDEYTIPSALARQLADAGVAIRVVNLGERGWVRGQALAYLQRLLQSGEKPALVVFYDGANDVFADAVQNAAGAPQNESNRQLEFRSATNIIQWMKAGLNQLEGFKKLVAAQPPSVSAAEQEKLAQSIIVRYQQQAAQLQSLADAHGFKAVVAWQPVIFSRHGASDFERDVIASSLRQHRDIHLLATKTLKASNLAGHPDFVDLSGVLDQTQEPVYMDFCHVSEAANDVIAQALAQKILPRLRLSAQ